MSDPINTPGETNIQKINTPVEPSLRTNRFRTFVLTEASIFVVGILALLLGADPTLAGLILGHLLTAGSVAYGFGSMHDAKVRTSGKSEVNPTLSETPSNSKA